MISLPRLRLGGTLDRYVAWLFALSYMAAFFIVVGLYLVVDMAVNLDDYMRPDKAGQSPSSIQVARYYLLQVPFLYLQMSPYVSLVAGMFTAAKMTRYREVVASLNAGVSKQRLFAPVLLFAALLAGGMFGFREWATSALGSRRDALLDRITSRRVLPVYEKFWVYTPSGHTVRLDEYHPRGLSGEPGASPVLRGMTCRYRSGSSTIAIRVEEASPLDDGRWEVQDGQRLVADAQALRQESMNVLEEVRFTPADVELAWKGRKHALELSFSESRRLLERDPSNVQYRTLLHYHITFPLAGLILLGVGLPFALGQARGRAGERVAKGFFLCVSYFAFEFVLRTLGLQGQIGPLFAGWVPVMGFGALGVVLFSSMRT